MIGAAVAATIATRRRWDFPNPTGSDPGDNLPALLCLPCGVAWRGEEPCWSCGHEGRRREHVSTGDRAPFSPTNPARTRPEADASDVLL